MQDRIPTSSAFAHVAGRLANATVGHELTLPEKEFQIRRKPRSKGCAVVELFEFWDYQWTSVRRVVKTISPVKLTKLWS